MRALLFVLYEHQSTALDTIYTVEYSIRKQGTRFEKYGITLRTLHKISISGRILRRSIGSL